MIIFILIFTFMIIGLLQLPALLHQQQWKELLIYLSFMIPAFVLSLLQSMGMRIWSPIPMITKIVSVILSI